MIDNFIYGNKFYFLWKILSPGGLFLPFFPQAYIVLHYYIDYSPFLTNRIIFVPQVLQTPDIAFLPLEVVILFVFTISLLARHFTQ
jgi:hypothetical protein